MSKLVVSQFVSLDGVMEDPRWTFEFDRGDDGDKFKDEELKASDVLLLGRVTYEGFAKAWPSRTGDEFSDKFNNMPKQVASTTLEDPEWNNSIVIQGDVPEAVAELKQESGGDILINGSRTLVLSLMEHELIDEYRLMVFPVVLGTGMLMFPEGSPKTMLKLADSRTVGPDGVIVLTYVTK